MDLFYLVHSEYISSIKKNINVYFICKRIILLIPLDIESNIQLALLILPSHKKRRINASLYKKMHNQHPTGKPTFTNMVEIFNQSNDLKNIKSPGSEEQVNKNVSYVRIIFHLKQRNSRVC